MSYLLVVEDDVELAELMAELLTDHGHEVGIAPNGLAGLHSLTRRRADLILLDLMMPLMSGPEMLQEVRNDPQLANIPVVLVTAMREVVPPGPGVLHDAIVTKPYQPDHLLGVIDKFLTGN